MTALIHRSVRCAGLALLIGAAGASMSFAETPSPAGGDVTEQDVARSNQKLQGAYGELVKMWTDNFSHIGRRFVAPQVARYRGAARTACGIIQAGNAQYCEAANAVYYDEVFVARQAKAAANQLGTDGDMAGIGIIAHEVGHAVAMQLGDVSRDSYSNEATADCLAGAFALQAQHDGELEAGDMNEALFGMASAGDPVFRSTGNQRIDSRIAMRVRRAAHGTGDQRTANFRAGYNSGPGACLSEFAS